MKRESWRVGVAIGVIAVGAALLLIPGPQPTDRPDSSSRVADATNVGGYLGDDACAECHREQMAAHAQSGHSNTIRPASEVDFAAELNGLRFSDPVRNVEFHYVADSSGLAVRIPERFGDEEFPLDYAFGSGLHAVTFVTLVPDLSIPGDSLGVEHRMSWIAGGPGVTPQPLPAGIHSDVEYFGRLLAGERLERCFGCHTTTCQIQNQQLVDLRPNVGCERCHGPGAQHVAAIAAGAKDLAIKVTRPAVDAAAEVAACAECHRGAERVPSDELYAENTLLVRFQPIGLSQSACFLQSGGRLGCSTCHDPHAPSASRSITQYEAACLNCHGQDTGRSHCTVSDTTGCIACHMPPVQVHDAWQFHDHWIRIRNDRRELQSESVDKGDSRD
jgi:predicted CXXCH cytochrome family protein